MIRRFADRVLNAPKKTALLCGILSAFAFPPFYLIFLLVFGLCGVWYLADRAKSAKKATSIGYWYGFGFFATGFYWVGNALLIDLMTFGWLYPIALLGAGAFFGLFMILPFALWPYARTPLKKITTFSIVWVIMEWVRSFILTGFPWNLLGTITAFCPELMQGASVIGTYGLSFIVLFWIGLLYTGISTRRRWLFAAFIAFPCALYALGYARLQIADTHSIQSTTRPIRVRLVQPAIAQQLKWDQNALDDNLNAYIGLSFTDQNDQPDFVVWGETAVPFDPLESDMYRTLIATAAPENGYLITGVIRREDETAYNSLYVLDRNGTIADYYDKNHLVPFGEYIPLRRFLPKTLRPIAGKISDLGAGTAHRTLHIQGYPDMGALICYEIIFPNAIINRAEKPQWLILLSNDGWYGDSAGPYQHLVAARMRALEEGITIVRSANTGISAVIDPFGRVTASLGLSKSGAINVDLPRELATNTIYSHIDFLILSALFAGLILLFRPQKNTLR